MPTRSCRDVLAGIDRLVDGEASRLERTRFALHLAMCPPCERYVRQYIAARDAAGALDAEALPDDFDQVMRPILKAIGALAEE